MGSKRPAPQSQVPGLALALPGLLPASVRVPGPPCDAQEADGRTCTERRALLQNGTCATFTNPILGTMCLPGIGSTQHRVSLSPRLEQGTADQPQPESCWVVGSMLARPVYTYRSPLASPGPLGGHMGLTLGNRDLPSGRPTRAPLRG